MLRMARDRVHLVGHMRQLLLFGHEIAGDLVRAAGDQGDLAQRDHPQGDEHENKQAKGQAQAFGDGEVVEKLHDGRHR